MTKYSDQVAAKLNFLLRKNMIIDGNFGVWQRNTSQTSSGYGSDDRWINSNSGSSKTHSRQSFTLGQTDVPGEPEYYSRTVVSSSAGASNYVFKYQKIESVRTLAGEAATFSFYAQSDSTNSIAIEFLQNFGTGGTPSASVTSIGVTTCNLTTLWQKFNITVSIPSISGKTLGSDNNDFLGVIFWFDAGSNFNSRTNSLGQQSGTFDIAQVQLEAGSVATDFEKRSFADELLLCQRFYCKTYDIETVPGTVVTGGRCILYLTSASDEDHTIQTFWKFPTFMRTSPTVTFYSDSSGASGKVRMSSGDVTPVSSSSNESGVHVSATNGATSTNRLLTFQATADAEL